MADTQNSNAQHNVFLSWSGEWAKEVATILRDWITDVVRQAKPWMSSEDIAKGSAWETEISSKLATCVTGIVVLTPHSVTAPWVLFEAGAISKSVTGHVCTLLCGLGTPVTGPLGRFQATACEEQDVLKLVKTLDADLGGESAGKLEHWFEAFWPKLQKSLEVAAQRHNKAHTPARQPTQPEMLEEILGAVRGLQRTQEQSLSRMLETVHETSRLQTERAMIERELRQQEKWPDPLSKGLLYSRHRRPITRIMMPPFSKRLEEISPDDRNIVLSIMDAIEGQVGQNPNSGLQQDVTIMESVGWRVGFRVESVQNSNVLFVTYSYLSRATPESGSSESVTSR